MRRRPVRNLTTDTDPVTLALRRARKARRRGELRLEVTALRSACAHNEFNATIWTLLGSALLRMSKVKEAADAFRHAVWLREREGDGARADITRQLIECAHAGLEPRARAAA